MTFARDYARRAMKVVVFFVSAALLACSSPSASPDAGDAATDAAIDASLDPGVPHCAVDGGGSGDPAAVPSFGAFSGDATGDVCLGGAYAVVHRDATRSLLVISTSDFGDDSAFFRFQSPADATTGSLAIVVELPQAAPGHYTNAGCADVELCAIMPAPSVDCGDAAAPATCPAGCDFVELGGPCGPAPPEQCFVARGTSDCSGTDTTPIGSYEVVIASLEPFGDAGDESVAHGVFRSVLASETTGAGSVTLTLGF